MQRTTLFIGLLLATLLLTPTLEAKRRHHRSTQPRRPHPVVLWARTIATSEDNEQRKVAAFKLSQYTQRIFQQEVIDTLFSCMSDPDTHIKVLCTKALGNVVKHGKDEKIQKALFQQYDNDPKLRSTVVRTLIAREDRSEETQEKLFRALAEEKDPTHLSVLIFYFEKMGDRSEKLVNALSAQYEKTKEIRVRRAIIKALSEKGQGEEQVIAILSECVRSGDTPLQLICLSGLESQAKNDPRAWTALGVALKSQDTDVLLASLDALITFNHRADEAMTKRLLNIATQIEDKETKEKAVLGINVTGNGDPSVVQSLVKIFETSDDEGVRIAAALVLGKQAASQPTAAASLFSECTQHETSQTLRTACQLAKQELETEKSKLAKQQAAPTREVTEEKESQK